jgi:hypothetical protein
VMTGDETIKLICTVFMITDATLPTVIVMQKSSLPIVFRLSHSRQNDLLNDCIGF